MPSALAHMAGQLTGDTPLGCDLFGRQLQRLRAAAEFLRSGGYADFAEAFERKADDPRENIDEMMGCNLKRGQHWVTPSRAAREAAADCFLRSAAGGAQETPWRQAKALLALLTSGDPTATSAFRDYGLPRSHARLARRLARARLTETCVYREAPPANAKSPIVRK